MIRRARFIGACLFVVTCFLATVQASDSDGLKVQGEKLLFQGQPIILRGVAVGDPILAREGRPLSDYMDIAKNWHANVVRLGIHPSVWKSMAHAEVVSKIRREVDAALAQGMFVIIDWHVIGWPDGFYEAAGYADDPKDLYDSNFALAQSYWDAIATEFGNDGRIVFELWNEPVFQKDDGEPNVGQKWKLLKPFMQKLVETVRAHGNNVVLATSNYWAYKLTSIRKDLLPGANIAYAWHVYAGHDENDEEQWAKALDHLQTVAPVMVTEWGFQADSKEHFRGSAKNFGTKFVRDFLEARHLHSTAWCWHPEWGPTMLKKDWKTPNAYGAFVQEYLRKANSPEPAP